MMSPGSATPVANRRTCGSFARSTSSGVPSAMNRPS